MSDAFDYIIVGGGTAGCVLANRLSADPDCRVLLLEAGGHNRWPSVRIPAGMSQAIGSSRLNWQYAVEEDASRAGRPDQWAAGRGLGGSSAINGLFYDRGYPDDYDDWANAGCAGWSWAGLAQYFERAEREPGAGPRFADTGVSLCTLPCVHPLSEVFLDAVAQCGTPLVPPGEGGARGASLVRVTQERGQRCSAADAYLRPARGRGNLRIRTGVSVERLCFDGRRCCAVELRSYGKIERVDCAGEVLLCAGAIGSPRLLQLSGVGDGEHLSRLGLPVVADLPGVGENLQEHPLAMLGVSVRQRTYNLDARSALRKAAILLRWLRDGGGPASSPFSQAAAFFPEPGTASQRPELEVLFAPHYFEWSADGPRPYPAPAVLGIVSLCRPAARGRVALHSADASAPPQICHRMLDADEDVQALRRGCRLLRDIFAADAFRGQMDGELLPGSSVQSDADWEGYLRESVVGGNHLVGTCRMGEDAQAVVDPALRVHGLEALRVVDASIMPTLPSTHTNATVLAIAEKAAAEFLGAG